MIRKKEELEEEMRLYELAEKRKKKRLATLELEGYKKGDLLGDHLKKSKMNRKINKAVSSFNVAQLMRSGNSFRENKRGKPQCSSGLYHGSLDVHGGADKDHHDHGRKRI